MKEQATSNPVEASVAAAVALDAPKPAAAEAPKPVAPSAPKPSNDAAKAKADEAKRIHEAAVAAVAKAEAIGVTSAATIARLRSRRLRTIGLRLGLGTLLPTILAGIYLGVIASPQYESSATFTIESREGGSMGGLEIFSGGNALGAALRDTILAREQIASRDMSDYLVREHGFARHYEDRRWDPWFRLDRGASREDVFEYYLEQVDAEFDWQTGVIRFRVRAFTRRDAERFADAILLESERRMNERMERARRDTLSLAEREVARAEERLEQARAAVAEIRAEGGELDPRRTAEATVAVRSQVELQLAAAQAELVALLQNMQPDAPQVVAARQRVNGLIASVSRQTQRMVADGQDDMQSRLETYEPAVLRKEMAQEGYTAAVQSLEHARRQVIQQHRYLVRVAGPTSPGESTYPELFLGTLTVFLMSLGVVIIVSLLLASVREHVNV